MAPKLTTNGILVLNSDIDLHLVLQIVEVHQMGSAQFRLVLSDGVNLQEVMLGMHLNEKVKNNLVVKGSIVQLLEYMCYTGHNLKMFAVLNMEVVELKAEIIGDPKYLNAGREQQTALRNSGPGPGLEGVQQLLARVSAPPFVADAVKSGNLFRSVGSGLGQTLGTGIDKGIGGFSMGQARSGGYSLYPSTGVGVKPDLVVSRGATGKSDLVVSKGASGRPDLVVSKGATGKGAGVGYGQQQVTSRKPDLVVSKGATGKGAGVGYGQQQVTSGRPMAAYQRALVYGNRGPVEPCYDEDLSIPKQLFDFRPISDVETLENNAMIDIIGVVVAINPTSTILRKNGSEIQKKTIQMTDWSGKSVLLTMWGAYCSKEGQELQDLCDSGAYPILAVKGGRLNDYKRRRIVSTICTTQLVILPSHPQMVKVQEWFASGQRGTYGSRDCYTCGQSGHFARDCSGKRRDFHC